MRRLTVYCDVCDIPLQKTELFYRVLITRELSNDSTSRVYLYNNEQICSRCYHEWLRSTFKPQRKSLIRKLIDKLRGVDSERHDYSL